MKPFRLLLALALGAFAACATNAGHWEGYGGKMDRAALTNEISKSMASDQWIAEGSVGGDPVYVKPGAGGHRTIAVFHYVDVAGNGTNFELTGKSTHVVNWLTFGILGAATQVRARNDCAQWLEIWNRAHPRS